MRDLKFKHEECKSRDKLTGNRVKLIYYFGFRISIDFNLSGLTAQLIFHSVCK